MEKQNLIHLLNLQEMLQVQRGSVKKKSNPRVDSIVEKLRGFFVFL